MRRRNWIAVLAVLALTPLTAHAQNKQSQQAQRQIGAILDAFREDMRGYERELKYFHRVAEFQTLLGLHNQLNAQAVQLNKLGAEGPGSGPAVLAIAREMDRTVRQLDGATARLEKRAEAVSSSDDRAVAVRMKTHSDNMVKTIDKLIGLFR